MTPDGAGALTTRRAEAADEASVLALAARALGWQGDDRDAAFFAWKHRENPFGPSPMWLALDGDRVAGFRTFLRWEFDTPEGGVARAVRAVDTATDPDYQGRGIFSRLTLQAVDELRDEGIAFVFNTPNEKSRPGYLKMGWQVVGRVPVAVRPRSLPALVRMATSRVAAEKWSEASPSADSAADVISGSDAAIDDLLASLPRDGRLRTRRSPAYLRWRYRFEPLHYRAVTGPRGLADGLAVFRVRRRGKAREAALCEVLAPGADARAARMLMRQVVRVSGADYVVRGGAPDVRAGFVPLVRQGPILTWRSVTAVDQPDLAVWHLELGDVELF